MTQRNRDKRKKRSFATSEDAIVSAFDDPAAVHLDSGGTLQILLHQGTLEMIDTVSQANKLTRSESLRCILLGEEVRPSLPVYVLSVLADDPRARARDNPLTVGSDDPSDPPIAFIATQSPTATERQALEGHCVLVRLVGRSNRKRGS